MQGDTFDLKFMNYNVLADFYLNTQVRGAIRNKDNECWPFFIYDFDYRFDLIKQELKESDSDIMCFEELDHSHRWKKLFDESGYGYVLQEQKDALDNVTCLLAYKKDKFKLEMYHETDFNGQIQTNKSDGIHF